ncbi:MAG TPA: DNA gyrase subunit A [Planctomycetota bacterium]|nr:DNA gyrase subunit A [Planctomycetota bacterium]
MEPPVDPPETPGEDAPFSRDPPDRIKDLLIEEEMKTSYLRYAMSVIVSRALPDVRDGLKPSQRRILVAMHDLNLTPGAKYRKCAKIAGDTSGNYHPHGEAVIYPTLVRLAQPFNMRVPLVDGQGNYGSVDGDPPAAMRYTEARMTAAAVDLLADLELDTVDYRPNYDESRTEPTVLPGKFPNLLVNGSIGIAVGMASNIPPHNPGEVCDALIRYINNPECELAELMEVLPGPDFPTGGVICGRQGILDAYATGRGRLIVRGRITAEEEKEGRWVLTVEEIPYPPRRDLIIDRIAELVKEGVLPGISRIDDFADRTNPYRIQIQLKKGEDPKVTENLLYQHTPLQETFGVNAIALVNGRPETLGLKELLKNYRDYRIEVVRRRTRFLLAKAEARAHIVEGLLKALDIIDQVIDTIRKSESPEMAQARLVDRFQFTEKQADAILRMTLARLTGLERKKLVDELEELRKRIAEYKAILGSERKVLDVIVGELEEVKAKHGRRRATEITGEAIEFAREELVPPEDVVVTMSRGGYLKRVKLDTYRAQGRGGRGIIGAATKEEDFITQLWSAHTHDTLLFLTNRGRAFAKRVFEVPELSRESAGRNIKNLLELREGEEVTSAFAIKDFDDRDILFATRQGVVKKVTLSLLRNAARQTGIIACELDDGDSLLGAALLVGGEGVILATAHGMAIRFLEGDVRRMGRAARGVRGIKLRKGDEVVGLAIAREGAALLTLCENGYGKRTLVSEYRPQTRGGLGLKDIQTTERNGKVVATCVVDEADEIVLISAKGMIVRTRVGEISLIGRNTQGVRVMNPKAGDRLLACAVVPPQDDGSGAPPEPTGGAPTA